MLNKKYQAESYLELATKDLNIHNAIAWEKQLKGWSRKKKEALFIEDWEEIKRRAKSKTSLENISSSTSSN